MKRKYQHIEGKYQHIEDTEEYRRHVANEGRDAWNDNPDGCYFCGSDNHHSNSCPDRAVELDDMVLGNEFDGEE